MEHVRKILCPLDFNEASGKAISKAAELAEHFGAELNLFHVLPLKKAADAQAIQLFPRDLPLEDRRNEAYTHLWRLASEHVIGHCTIRCSVSSGGAAEQIVSRARVDIDFIVMGSHGMSGCREVAVGSVTSSVIRTAPCPVMTIPMRSLY